MFKKILLVCLISTSLCAEIRQLTPEDILQQTSLKEVYRLTIGSGFHPFLCEISPGVSIIKLCFKFKSFIYIKFDTLDELNEFIFEKHQSEPLACIIFYSNKDTMVPMVPVSDR